jgi:hypothetical protein
VENAKIYSNFDHMKASIKPMGLAQLVVNNVAGHLANSVPAHAWFESPGVGTLVYDNGFNRAAIHKCGEASLGFPREVFLGKRKKN